jgi:homoserine O-acetyltransferase
MTKFESSDDVRSAAPLEHAQYAHFDGPVRLELGGELPHVDVCYETYGRLSEDRSNAVLICHALSGDSHVARHHEGDQPGWWDIAVGPGKPIDTDKYFVICPNVLGGCRGTTGPLSVDPRTGGRYGADFPTITTGDIVDVQRMLIDHLGIQSLLAVIGGSMGGHQVLEWAHKYPARTRGLGAIATSARLSCQALAFDVVARNAILQDPAFAGGDYYENPPGPAAGLAIARMIGHITYLSPQAMQEKFDVNRLVPRDVPMAFEKKFSVGSYLGYQGQKFVERFDANSYIVLTMAMDLFDLGDSIEDLRQAIGACAGKWLVLSYTSDWLFTPRQSQDIVQALLQAGRDVTYCNVRSDCGHDAFLLEDDLDRYGGLIEAFLASASGKPLGRRAGKAHAGNSTSIFHPQRLDYDQIADLIPPDESVLDLGCGNGELLAQLRRPGRRLLGVELDEQMVLACARRGLNVIQGDLNQGLGQFAGKQFDVVVLSQTLQAVRDVEGVVDHMLRVGRRCIVSFPNFGYHKLRQMLSEHGKAPETSGLLHHRWYNSPNIRFFSIADFEDFCNDKHITIHRRIALDTEEGREVAADANLLADLAIFVISG